MNDEPSCSASEEEGELGFSVVVRKKGSWVFCRSEVRNMGYEWI